VSATGSNTYTSATLVITKSGGVSDMGATINSAGPWQFSWMPAQGPGTYVGTATVTNATGCWSSVQQVWQVVVPACNTCAAMGPSDPDPSAGSHKYYRQQNTIGNSCSFNLKITSASIRARSICPTCATPLKLQKLQFLPTCNGGVDANRSCTVNADCPSSTCNTTTFSTENLNLVYSAPGLGANVSTSETATVDFSAASLTIPANSSNAKFRWIFSAITPVWAGSTSALESVLEADVCFAQGANLCSPSCITGIRLEP
jgi:hypothetical protein